MSYSKSSFLVLVLGLNAYAPSTFGQSPNPICLAPSNTGGSLANGSYFVPRDLLKQLDVGSDPNLNIDAIAVKYQTRVPGTQAAIHVWLLASTLRPNIQEKIVIVDGLFVSGMDLKGATLATVTIGRNPGALAQIYPTKGAFSILPLYEWTGLHHPTNWRSSNVIGGPTPIHDSTLEMTYNYDGQPEIPPDYTVQMCGDNQDVLFSLDTSARLKHKKKDHPKHT